MIWAEFATAAPELARLAEERFDRAGLALLGTLRRDGSPRISPVEPCRAEGHLLFGAMTWSMKAKDLLRDPRCVLHSVVSDPEGSEGELKLYGRADEIRDPELRDSCSDAWWTSAPTTAARVFSLSVEQAAFVSWDAGRGEMTMKRWSAERGAGVTTRSYP
jgi:hypothetical protein